MGRQRGFAKLVARPVREFLRIEAAGSALLLFAAAAALVWANVGGESYGDFWHHHLKLEIGAFQLDETLAHWVNDGLMVIFFFVVGLEIKYEIVHGDLRDPKTAAMPIAAALGGMLLPAALYALVVGGGEGSSGWGIPMATDIAFAVGVIGLLGRRIPSAARLFLLTLAIVDDIGAIIVIAVFYTSELHLDYLAYALLCLAAMLVLRAFRVWVIWIYALLGVICWYTLLESGVHATLAGVAIGLLTPAVPLIREKVSVNYAKEALQDNDLSPDEVFRLRFLLGESVPMVERLQNVLHPVSSYVVLPIFALANAGVALGGGVIGEAVTAPITLGIVAGLVIGKPVGILLASFIATRLGIAKLPENTGWRMIGGLGFVAGIGFTVSLFIAELSFDEALLTEEAKVGILGASLIAAVIGVLALRFGTPTPEDAGPHDDVPPADGATERVSAGGGSDDLPAAATDSTQSED